MRQRTFIWGDTVLRISTDYDQVHTNVLGRTSPGNARRIAKALNDAADAAEKQREKDAETDD